MVNQQVLTGKWNEISGKLKEKWGKLSDDDLRIFNGNVDQLVGRIQRKTGETREAIEDFLGEVADETSEAAGGLRDLVHETAHHAADAARQGYDVLRERYSDAERTVQARPAQSVAVAFGLGAIAGIGLAILVRDRGGREIGARTRGAAEEFGRQMLDALSKMLPHGGGQA